MSSVCCLILDDVVMIVEHIIDCSAFHRVLVVAVFIVALSCSFPLECAHQTRVTCVSSLCINRDSFQLKHIDQR